MDETNEYEFEVHFTDRARIEITRRAKTRIEALAIAEFDYQDEFGYSAVISVDPNKELAGGHTREGK